MSQLKAVRQQLVEANRILAHEGVFDSYGHISVRHPDDSQRFLLAASVSPEQVQLGDILEYAADAQPVTACDRAQYSERYIHAAIYAARPDVQAVVHGHADAVLPFTVTPVKLRPVLHVAAIIGAEIPVWDMTAEFGDTDLLVNQMPYAESLARSLGDGRVVLMRGHGFTAAAQSLELAVRVSVYLQKNAQLQAAAMALGEVHYLSEGEVAAAERLMGSPKATARVWQNWVRRAGCVVEGEAGV